MGRRSERIHRKRVPWQCWPPGVQGPRGRRHTQGSSPGTKLLCTPSVTESDGRTRAQWVPPPCSPQPIPYPPYARPHQASPALGSQRPPQAPGGRCASHLLGLQTEELHLPHAGLGRVPQRPLVRPAHGPLQMGPVSWEAGGRRSLHAHLTPEGQESQERSPRQCVGQPSARSPRSGVCLDLRVRSLPGAIPPLLPSGS